MRSGELLWIDVTDQEPSKLTKFKAKSHTARVTHERRRRRTCYRAVGLDVRSKVAVQQQQQHSLAPWTGKSDPFQSQAIRITPFVSQVLHFLIHVWVPAISMRSDNAISNDFKAGANGSVGHLCYDTLQDESSAHTLLLPYATMLTQLSQSAEINARRTEFKLIAIKRVRDTVGGGQDSDLLMWLVASLFLDAVTEHNFTEARSHGLILRELMHRKTDRDGHKSLDLRLFYRILWYDVFRSNSTLTPSLFDVDEWGMAVLKQHTKGVFETIEPMLDHFARQVDESVGGTPLESFCAGFKVGFWLWEKKMCDPDGGGADMWQWVLNNYCIMQLQCTNYYVHARTMARTAAGGQTIYWHTQACIALSMLLCQVNHISDPRLESQSYWPRGKRLAEALQYHLSCAIGDKDNLSRSSLPALLFSTWTGCTFVYKESRDFEVLAASYFCISFADLAFLSKIEGWDEIEAVISRFMPAIMSPFQAETKFRHTILTPSDRNTVDSQSSILSVPCIIQRHYDALSLCSVDATAQI